MQPGMAGRFGTVWQQRVVGVLATTAAEAATRRGADRIAIQPFDHAAFKCTSLSLSPRQSAVELGNSRPLVKVNLPVLARPTVTRAGAVPRFRPCAGKAHRARRPAAPRLRSTRDRRHRGASSIPAARAAFKASTALIAVYSRPRQFFQPTGRKAAKAVKAVIWPAPHAMRCARRLPLVET